MSSRRTASCITILCSVAVVVAGCAADQEPVEPAEAADSASTVDTKAADDLLSAARASGGVNCLVLTAQNLVVGATLTAAAAGATALACAGGLTVTVAGTVLTPACLVPVATVAEVGAATTLVAGGFTYLACATAGARVGAETEEKTRTGTRVDVIPRVRGTQSCDDKTFNQRKLSRAQACTTPYGGASLNCAKSACGLVSNWLYSSAACRSATIALSSCYPARDAASKIYDQYTQTLADKMDACFDAAVDRCGSDIPNPGDLL